MSLLPPLRRRNGGHVRASALPDLGPHGEGWFAAQLVLFAAIAAAGAAGPEWQGTLRAVSSVAGLVLMAGGGFLAVRGVLDLGTNLTPFPKPLARAALVECGAYGVVRHPIYGGLIMGAVGWGLALASLPALALAFVLAAFFDLKSRREEAWLEEKFAGYPAYRSRTKKLLPGLY
jgi:protein-S-isoprenylcysteine O-methyltransferase Ste14